ncbi:MAG: LysM peptidoglycan-binding domain-containing protein [Ignavibacteria bacterium]|nr:LysM peptidoglycan-binding domain-containing protein [Ignavibacteria bacterium]
MFIFEAMNIEVKENSQDHFVRSELPFDSVFTGSEGTDDGTGIHIRQSTLRKIEDYLSEDKSNELGGVLIGDVCETEGGAVFVKIENVIFAMHASSSLSRLTFTHETWDYINKVLEDEYPGKRIVGWFHSHPGHTVFMSSHDIFIHENFFSNKYMVAYVFDPTIRERGFFKWSGNEIIRANGFHIYDNDGGEKIYEFIDKSVDEDAEKIKKEIKGGKIDIMKSITIALSIFSFLLTAFMAYNFVELKKKTEAVSELSREVAELKAKLALVSLNESKTVVKEQSAGNTGKDNSPAINSGKPEDAEKNRPATEPVSNKNEEKVADGQNTAQKQESKKYTIKKGDTLERIALSTYGSRDGIELIMKHNNIKDKTSIKIGQTIELPVKN